VYAEELGLDDGDAMACAIEVANFQDEVHGCRSKDWESPEHAVRSDIWTWERAA
jgi:hypothetical protein